jgi:hypothetical protein
MQRLQLLEFLDVSGADDLAGGDAALDFGLHPSTQRRGCKGDLDHSRSDERRLRISVRAIAAGLNEQGSRC